LLYGKPFLSDKRDAGARHGSGGEKEMAAVNDGMSALEARILAYHRQMQAERLNGGAAPQGTAQSASGAEPSTGTGRDTFGLSDDYNEEQAEGPKQAAGPLGALLREISPEQQQYQSLIRGMGSVVNADGSESPLNDEQVALLAQDLQTFDLQTLENLKKSGVTIKVGDPHVRPPDGFPGGRPDWPSNVGGYYANKTKTLVFNHDDLSEGTRDDDSGHIVRHEASHAVDDMMMADAGKDNPKLYAENDPALVSMFQQYKERIAADPNNAWSGNSQRNPREYMAEGMSFYLGTDEERELLKNSDPALYSYVEKAVEKAKTTSQPQDDPNAQPQPDNEQKPPSLLEAIGNIITMPFRILGDIFKGIGDGLKNLLGGLFGQS